MITKLFRITHQDGDDYHAALCGSLKASSVCYLIFPFDQCFIYPFILLSYFQVNRKHTDLDFYCADGIKISCHRAFILRFSTTLSSLVRKQVGIFFQLRIIAFFINIKLMNL